MVDYLAVACAVGSGLMAGFLFAFSNCVMKALGRLPREQGIAAMQAINVAVINRWFLSVFFGSAALCVAATGGAFVRSTGAGAWLMLAGSALYVVGTIGVTVRFNVPGNDALASIEPSSVEGARVWVEYLARWTAWNHIRAVAAVAATTLFVLGRQSWA
ncbi:MAG: DUF1772 domain-containing protein [Burkholderiales bacterium]|nr:DUF1772 domain-containing protein [Burkholderiales bacterium]